MPGAAPHAESFVPEGGGGLRFGEGGQLSIAELAAQMRAGAGALAAGARDAATAAAAAAVVAAQRVQVRCFSGVLFAVFFWFR